MYANYDGRMNYAVLMKDACPDDAVIWFLNSVDTAKQDILTRDESPRNCTEHPRHVHSNRTCTNSPSLLA